MQMVLTMFSKPPMLLSVDADDAPQLRTNHGIRMAALALVLIMFVSDVQCF